MSNVLDNFGPDVYRSGLGGDSPGPDLRGDQLPGSDQEGGQLGAASEGEKMKINELITKLETMQAVWGNIAVYFNSGENRVERVESIRVALIPIEDNYVLVLDDVKSKEEIENERKRLMEGLEKCSGIRTNEQDVCQKCPYFKEEDCTGKLAKDALARIKELESK